MSSRLSFYFHCPIAVYWISNRTVFIFISREKDIFYSGYLWDDDESESEAKQHQVHPVHPAQEDEVGGHRGAKVTWMETGMKFSSLRHDSAGGKLTFHLFDFPLPRDAGCSEVLEIPLELDPFLGMKNTC